MLTFAMHRLVLLVSPTISWLRSIVATGDGGGTNRSRCTSWETLTGAVTMCTGSTNPADVCRWLCGCLGGCCMSGSSCGC